MAKAIDLTVGNWQDQLWEELTCNDDLYANWYPAISKLQEAMSLIYQATSKLEMAADWTEGTGAENRIASLAMELDRLADAVSAQANQMQ